MIFVWLGVYFLIFLLAVFLLFYLPGKFLLFLFKTKLGPLEDVVFPTILGAVLFTLICYYLSWIKLFWLVVPIVGYIDCKTIVAKQWKILPIPKKEISSILMLSFFAIFFSLTTLLSGEFGNTIRLIGTHKADSLWHLTLINEFRENFPPTYPNLSGIPLKSYHFFYDFLLAKISNIFFIPPTFLFFQFFPLLISFLWSFGLYILMKIWSKKNDTSLWAVFLSFFGGSFSFLLPLYGHKGYSLDDAFGITQPATSLINPPFAISVVFIVGFLFALFKYLDSREKKWIVSLVLFSGTIAMFKVYAGILLVGVFLFLSFIELYKNRKIFLVAILTMSLIFFTTYWVFAGAGGTLIYAPLWAPHKVLQDHFPWYGYDEKIYTFSHLGVIRGVIETEAYSLYVFIFGNLGTRMIGLIFVVSLLFSRKKKYPSFFFVNVLFLILISFLIPLFFIQSIQPFDIIQIAWYFLFFISLVASFGFSALFRFRFSRLLKIILFVCILVITLPSAYEKYSMYLAFLRGSPEANYYTSDYINALHFLRNQGSYNSVLLEAPLNDVETTPRSIDSWFTKSSRLGILAFGNKKGYYTSGFINTKLINLSEKKELIMRFVTLENTKKTHPIYPVFKKELLENLQKQNVRYIFASYPLSYLEGIKEIRLIYKNPSNYIYERS